MTHIQIYFSSPVMCMAGDDCCRDLFSVCLPRGLRSPLSQARGIRCYEDSIIYRISIVYLSYMYRVCIVIISGIMAANAGS